MSQPVRIALTVNGEPVEAMVEPRTHLADFLRGALGLTGTHIGCEHGVCGACTVMIDGQPARSCISFAATCDGSDVRTVEGFGDDPTMQALREAFSRHHALQCGYCTPGMLITARDVVARLSTADEQRVRLELSGNLCRCTGYMGIVGAVREVAARVAEGALPAVLPTSSFGLGLPVAAAVPAMAPAAAGAVPAPPPTAAEAVPTAGWVEMQEGFSVPMPPDRVWPLFEDPAAIAACMPGAEITGVDGERLRGQLRVRLGPIRGAFAGEGTYRADPAARSGVLRGQGLDSGSGSRTHGEVSFRLSPSGDGTAVALDIRYHLAGPLAQIGRGGLVRDVARRLVSEFARNLSARLDGHDAPAPAAAELNTASLTLAILWQRLRRLFGA